MASSDYNMINIPPEGDAYNKEREEQLYAGITNRTMLQRRYVEMVAAGATQDQINECLSAIAQTDRDISRLSLELHNSTQGRNLNIFMVRMEAALKEYEANNTLLLAGVSNNLNLLNLTVEQVLTTAQEALTVSKAGAARLGKLEDEVTALNVRHGEQIAEIVGQLQRGEIERRQITDKLDTYIAGNKREELAREVDALKRRMAELEARGD